MTNKQKYILVSAIVAVAVIVDQIVKCYVKLHFRLGEMVEVFPWFQICFVENDGMAFGIEWFDKMFLTLFRILAVGALGWYTHSLIKHKVNVGYLVVIACVMAGALGNIVDCLFYGLIFSPSTPYTIATLVPFGEGYAPFFYGKVVDMLYFPLIHDAAGYVLFFRPVFNIADSFITCSVIAIMLFYRQTLNDSLDFDSKKSKDVAANQNDA